MSTKPTRVPMRCKICGVALEQQLPDGSWTLALAAMNSAYSDLCNQHYQEHLRRINTNKGSA